MNILTKKFYFVFQEFDPILNEYPNKNSDFFLSDFSRRSCIKLPNTSLNSDSIFKKEKFFFVYSEYLPRVKKQSVNGFITLIKPEYGTEKLKILIENLKASFKNNYEKFTVPVISYFLIIQYNFTTHYQILKKIGFLGKLVQELNYELSDILLFPKFLDSANPVWPVIIKDIRWLNQFQGDITVQNAQFIKLLKSFEQVDFTDQKMINLPSSKTISLSKSLCFGCRGPINQTSHYIICNECGAILCQNCLNLLQQDLNTEILCPGNIYLGANYHTLSILNEK